MNHRLGLCAKLFTSPTRQVKWAYWKKAFFKSVVLKAISTSQKMYAERMFFRLVHAHCNFKRILQRKFLRFVRDKKVQITSTFCCAVSQKCFRICLTTNQILCFCYRCMRQRYNATIFYYIYVRRDRRIS